MDSQNPAQEINEQDAPEEVLQIQEEPEVEEAQATQQEIEEA